MILGVNTDQYIEGSAGKYPTYVAVEEVYGLLKLKGETPSTYTVYVAQKV